MGNGKAIFYGVGNFEGCCVELFPEKAISFADNRIFKLYGAIKKRSILL